MYYSAFLFSLNLFLSDNVSYLIYRFGRDGFQEASLLAKKARLLNADWTKFKYVVFDVPNHKGTYAERYNDSGM